MKTTSPTPPARSSNIPSFEQFEDRCDQESVHQSTQPLNPRRCTVHRSWRETVYPGSPSESPSTDDGEPPLDEAAAASTSSSRRPSQTAKTLESIRDYAKKTLMSPHGQVRDLGESSTAPQRSRIRASQQDAGALLAGSRSSPGESFSLSLSPRTRPFRQQDRAVSSRAEAVVPPVILALQGVNAEH